MPRREYKNLAEQRFAQFAVAEGWEITKQGWPDFLCFNKGKLFVVEVKPNSHHNLKKAQRRCLEALASHEIDSFLWTPDQGLHTIWGDIPLQGCRDCPIGRLPGHRLPQKEAA